MDTSNNCIGCGKKIHRFDSEKAPWFCSEWCAAYCKMFSIRAGVDCSPEAALEKLTLRHLGSGDPKDLVRIERILERLAQVK